MFCPECQAEYRDGFTRCADCEVDLVRERLVKKAASESDARAATNKGKARREPDPTASMFCPLCKAGFREGFKICSDCQLPLVDSQQQAEDCPVSRLWHGKDRNNFEAYLTVLQSEGIAHRFKEHMKVQPTYQFQIFGFSLFPKKDALWNEYEIFVLQKDLDRANSAIHSSA